ncbi:MAG: protoporphyrinogen oxidase [Planctomycetota bacterium]|nr:protoporphyrinogen oxidase [Planctomycetota bacterium]MDG1983109.1 protoporphyrinogen oxidase [Planctomycetota bacterium]
MSTEAASDSRDMNDVIVVGAGLTGLACALELQARGLRVLVLEATRRAGGVVGTGERNGFLFESGPNTVPASAKHVREAAERLGLSDKLITSNQEAKRRYLFKDGGLHELPSSPMSLLRTPLLSTRAKLKILSEPLRRFRSPASEAEPTFEAFLSERIGREAARTLAGAFVRGVYAAEIEELGARSAFPRMHSLCTESGGLVRGMLAQGRRTRRARDAGEPLLPGPRTSPGDLISFQGGFRTLIDGYHRALDGALSLTTAVAEIDRGPGGWRAVLESGESLACRDLVLATPAPATYPLVALCAPERLNLDALLELEHAAVTAVHLGLENVTLPPGFGFLVPPDEEARRDPRTPGVLGTLFTSRLFNDRAPSGTSSVTSMFRGGDVADLVGDSLVDRALIELERALAGYRSSHPDVAAPAGAPRVVASLVQRWTNVIPRYAPEHDRRMAQLVAGCARHLPGLHLAGSYIGGVSVDDRIRTGTLVASAAAQRLSHVAGRDGASSAPTTPPKRGEVS